MRDFDGTDRIAVSILNRILKIIRYYEVYGNTSLEGVLYVGRKEWRAIQTLGQGDLSINRNLTTGEIRLYDLLVVPVVAHSYAAIHPSIILESYNENENENETDSKSD